MNTIIAPSNFPYARVGLTGGTGTIGRQWVKVLLGQLPHVQQVITNCRRGRSRRIPASPRIRVLEGGMDSLETLKAIVEEADIVYHLAAWLANLALPDPMEVYILNGLIPAVMSQLCARQQKPLVFTSSHSVYFAGEYKGLIQEDTFAFRRDFLDWIAAVRAPYYEFVDDILSGKRKLADAPQVLRSIHEKYAPPFSPKIYDNDSYHIYCLTKLLAEQFIRDGGGVVLRLSNVYGPGDESVQAVAEACQRILQAEAGIPIQVRQPFKKLVPCYMGDILKAFIRAGQPGLSELTTRVFTVASQDYYMREDALLRTVAACVNDIRGTRRDYDIETLPAESEVAFTYDLSKMKTHLFAGQEVVPFSRGLREQLLWMIERIEGKPERVLDVVVNFACASASNI